MTSVTRLYNLFKELESRKEEQVLIAWKYIFNTTDIFEVYNYLSNVNKELQLLENELIEKKLIDNNQFKNIIYTINTIINHPFLTQQISQISVMNPNNIKKVNDGFKALQTFIDAQILKLKFEEEVDVEKFDKFKKMLNETIDDIENSNLDDEEKTIFLSIFYDFNKAISLYKINGLDAFLEVIRNDLCKIKMVDELKNVDDNTEYDKFKILITKSISEVWFWIQIYQKVDNTVTLGSKVYGYLKNKISEITKNNKDIEDVEISE